MKRICTDILEIHYREAGSRDGIPVILLHGFPYDIHAFDEAVDLLTADGEKNGRQYRILLPYLRGYGPTRFLSDETMRSGEQAALAADLLAFMDGLGIQKAVLGGFDWGGRAACIVSALWPDRVLGLVTCGAAYNIQNPALFRENADPDREARSWYVYYFHTARGRKALAGGAKDLCRYLWETWSPDWNFSEEVFLKTAKAFENPDFAALVEHSYCHRTGEAQGDPRYEEMENRLCRKPKIKVPSMILLGSGDQVTCPAYSADDDRMFSRLIEKKILPGVGHNVPQEAPAAFAKAIAELADLADC